MDFSSEEEVKKALKCNREYMGENRDGAVCTVEGSVQSVVDPAGCS